MKAAYVKTRNKVRIREIDEPVATPGGVVLQVEGCGVCGSDFLEATSWAKRWKRFGHEISGRVLTTGPDVRGFAEGDQVALALSVPCGNCPQCLANDPRRCSSMLVAEQGGYAERLLVHDTRLLCKVPEPVDPSLLIFVEPLTVVLDAFHTAGLKTGDSLAVVGGGFIGCLAILAAKALGVGPVLSLSRSSHDDLEICLGAVDGQGFLWNRRAGITASAPRGFAAALAGASGRKVVLHTAPPKYILNYFDALPFDSTVLNIGLSAKTKDNVVKIDASKLIFKRIQIMSGFPVPCLYLEEAVRLLTGNRELFSLLTPHRASLDELPSIIASRPKQKKKIMIIPEASGGGK